MFLLNVGYVIYPVICYMPSLYMDRIDVSVILLIMLKRMLKYASNYKVVPTVRLECILPCWAEIRG